MIERNQIFSPIHKIKSTFDYFGFSFYFSMLIGIGLIFGSIKQYNDVDLTSYASIIAFAIALIVPFSIILFTARFWVYNDRVFSIIKFAGNLFFIISGYVFIADFLNFLSITMVEAPPIMQLGFFWVYRFYSLVVYIASLFVQLFLSALERMVRTNQKPVQSTILDISGNSLISVGLSYIYIILFPRYGIFGVIISQLIVGSLHLLFNYKALIDSRQHIQEQLNINMNQNKKPLKFTLTSGFLNVFKGFFLSLPLFGIIVVNLAISLSFLVQSSLIPLWIQFYPKILISCILWLAVYWLFNCKKLIIISSSALILVIYFILNGNPESFLTQRSLILWLIALSISGTVIGFFLVNKESITGLFSKIFFALFGAFCCISGFLLGFMIKWGLYDDDVLVAMLYIAIPVLVIYLIGMMLGKTEIFKEYNQENKFNEGKALNDKVSHSDTANASIVVHTIPQREKKILRKETIIMGIILIALIVLPVIPISYARQISTEQVLATYNGDYYLWFADSLRTVDSEYRPNLPSSPINNTVKISMARGEHEGFQVVFTPWKVQNLNLWDFSVIADLYNEATDTFIDNDNITLYSESYVTQLHEQYPDRLYPFQRLDTRLDLDGQINYPYYIDVYIPDDESILPGIYETSFKFYCRDYHSPLPGENPNYHDRLVYFNLEVEVFNFTISRERHIGTEIIWGIPDTPDWVNFYMDYRLDAIWPPPPAIAYNADLNSGPLSITFNFTKWLADLDRGFELGMKYFPITWHPTGIDWSPSALNYTDEYKTLLTWYIANITDQLTGKKTPWNTDYIDHAYFFVIDEPPIYWDPLIINVSYIIHNVTDRIKIMETMNRDLSTYTDQFLSEVDIYCQYIHHWEPSQKYPQDSEVNKWPARLKAFVEGYSGPRSKELWVYHTHNRFPSPDTEVFNSGVMHRNIFWMHWIYNVTGYLYWSYNWGIDHQGGYGYANYGESVLVGYGENNQPLSSIRLERIRDGIEDFEYFWLLNDLLTKIDPSERIIGESLLEQVRNMFNQPEHFSHLPGYNSEMFEGFKWGYNPYSQPYLQLRNQIGSEINRIYSIL